MSSLLFLTESTSKVAKLAPLVGKPNFRKEAMAVLKWIADYDANLLEANKREALRRAQTKIRQEFDGVNEDDEYFIQRYSIAMTAFNICMGEIR